MENKVWIVTIECDYDGIEILDVFDTKEKALQFANEEITLRKDYSKKWKKVKDTEDIVQWVKQRDYLTCKKYEVK